MNERKDKPRAFRRAEFVDWLDACRGGDSIRWFAREAGVSASSIVRMKKGKNPDIETFARLMMLCGQHHAASFFDRRAMP